MKRSATFFAVLGTCNQQGHWKRKQVHWRQPMRRGAQAGTRPRARASGASE